MKRHIGTGKKVKNLEFQGSNKVKVFYVDLSSEEMSLKDYKVLIKEIKN